MDRDEKLLAAIASAPNGICNCCLVDRCGLEHGYVWQLCVQLRTDGKLRPFDVNVFLAFANNRRRQEPKETCGVCRKELPYGLVFHPISSQEAKVLATEDVLLFEWQQLGLAERLCGELPNQDRFQRLDSVWLNQQRSVIIRLLNKTTTYTNGESTSLGRKVDDAKKAGVFPSNVAGHMQTLLALRNSATYEDRRLDVAESLIARVAADEILMWEKQQTTRKGK